MIHPSTPVKSVCDHQNSPRLRSNVRRRNYLVPSSSSSFRHNDSTLLTAIDPSIDSVLESCVNTASSFSKKLQLKILQNRNYELSYVGKSSSSLSSFSNSSEVIFDNRGVYLSLFRAVREFCLSADANASVWSMNRVCALFAINQKEDNDNDNDNKDGKIEKDCYIIPSSASLPLNFSKKSSLIDMLKCNSMGESRSEKSELNISYEEAVGSNANVFICYSNEDNFIDLVNALDDLCSNDPDTFNSEDTVFYFELFVTDMWNIQSKKNMCWQIGSTGYMEKYRNFIKKMGHTICFVSDWKQPTYRKSTMSLFEIGQSDMITLFFPGRVEANLRYNIRYDYSSVCRSLCDGIRVENSISHSPFVEKDEIFRCISHDNGGLSGFNGRINKCLRDWLTAKTITGNLARDLYNQGFFDEASRLYKIAHESIERRIRGGDTVSSAAISIIYKLALCAKRLQNMSEAEQGLLKVLTFLESNLGQDNESVIRMYCELVHILHAQGKMHDAVKYFDRAIMGSLAAINEVNKSTLKKIDVLARVLENKEILKVIIEKLKFIGRSHPMSHHISKNLTTLLSKLDICQEKRIDALFTI